MMKTYFLSDIMDIIGGGTPKTSIDEYWSGDIPWLSVKDFNTDDKYVKKTEKCISKLGLENSSTVLLQTGDLIISARGTVGELAMLAHPMAFNQSCYGLRAKSGIVTNDFLYYLLKHNLRILKNNTHGSVFDTITRDTFDNIQVSLPSITTQNKISVILSALDDKIELNQRENNNLEQQAQALFNEKILNNPKQGCIGDYCSIKSGFAFKSSWWQNSGVRVIKIKNIESSELNLHECSYVSEDKISIAKDFVVKGGDLLIAMTGATIGKFAIVPYVDEILLVNQRVGKFFLGDNPLEKLPFIYCTLKQPEVVSEIINRGQGSAQPNISGNDIMSITCTYPDENIIANFNNICRPYFEKIIMNQYENTRLSALRDTLLPKLMSGEIDVSNVDISALTSTDKLSFTE